MVSATYIVCGKCGFDFEPEDHSRGLCPGLTRCPMCEEQLDAQTGDVVEGSCGGCWACVGARE